MKKKILSILVATLLFTSATPVAAKNLQVCDQYCQILCKVTQVKKVKGFHKVTFKCTSLGETAKYDGNVFVVYLDKWDWETETFYKNEYIKVLFDTQGTKSVKDDVPINMHDASSTLSHWEK